MADSFPLATLAAQVTSVGISAPSYADVLASLKASAQQIFGVDVYLEADSQDGQLLAVFAQAVHDCNQTTIATYNSFSPATAQGEGLSSVVKINNIRRAIATRSQVNVAIGGQVGTLITNGIVGDADGNRWALPMTVLIPPGGTITSTAVAEQLGAIGAPAATVTRILSPTAGWQSVTNPVAATPGQPIETDAELRIRQGLSPAISAISPLAGIAAALNALPGVTYGTIYENDTDSTNSDGLPPHSIAAVVKGGVAIDIAATIFAKKAPGVSTSGTTSIDIPDVSGALRSIRFTVPTEVAIKVSITLVAGANYTTTIGAAIQYAVAQFIDDLSIGEDLVVSRLYAPALLQSAQDSETYKINALTAALAPSGTLGTGDIVIGYTSKATCAIADVTITTA